MLRFNNPVDPASEVVIACVGDMLLQDDVQRQAFRRPGGWRALWRGVADLLPKADLTYASLVGTIAADVAEAGGKQHPDITGFDADVGHERPALTYPPELGPALRQLGIGIVSTANNHALDLYGAGITRTLQVLDEAGIAHVGTRKRGAYSHDWYTITSVGRYRVAWLAGTYGTDGRVDSDKQVFMVYQDREILLETIAELRERPDVDAIIVTPYWGLEHSHEVLQRQRMLAHQILEAGATAVIGSHPHVVQPWEKYHTADGRETLILYSLGNLISGDLALDERSSLILLLGLAETQNGKLAVAGVRYIPIFVNVRTGPDGDQISVEASERSERGRESIAVVSRWLDPGNIHPAEGPFATIADGTATGPTD